MLKFLRIRFSLRSLFLLTFLASVLLSSYVVPMRRLTQRQDALRAIRQAGGTVIMLEPSGSTRLYEWLYPWISGDTYLSVLAIDMTEAHWDSGVLTAFAVLNDAKTLRIDFAEMPSAAVEALNHMAHLESITIYHPSCEIGELANLCLRNISTITLFPPARGEEAAVASLLAKNGVSHIQFMYWTIDDSIADRILSMPSLRELDLLRCTVDVVHERDVDSGKRRLHAVRLHGGQLRSGFLKTLCGLQTLEVLELPDAKIEGFEAQDLQGLSRLRRLDLSGLPLSDQDLVHLKLLPSLSTLIIRDTSITDEGLFTLSLFAELEELHVNGTNVTPTGVREFNRLRPDCRLYHD